MRSFKQKILDARRETMIRDHLMARDIHDPAVLSAMRQVPREIFINSWMHDLAYDDNPLPIQEGQTISQPYIVAYMIQALRLCNTDRALEIGTGSGYAAAVLSRIANTVYSVERLPGLAESARQHLKILGYTNVIIHEGDGTLGWPEHAPYNAIIVSAGAPDIPRPLLDQLAINGRLVIPIGASQHTQRLVRSIRINRQDFRTEELCGVHFVPLIGAAGW